MASAKELINSLVSRGTKKSEIARKLGINSSTLSQIANDKKPGTNLVPALQSLNAGREAGDIERRKTKAGTPAKVRKPAAAENVIYDRKKRPQITKIKDTADDDSIKALLRRIAKEKGKVTVSIKTKRYEIDNGSDRRKGSGYLSLYSSRGQQQGRLQNPKALIDLIDNSEEGFTQFLIDEFEDSMNAEIFDVEEVFINAVY